VVYIFAYYLESAGLTESTKRLQLNLWILVTVDLGNSSVKSDFHGLFTPEPILRLNP
jgi:hypothetical protein